MKHEIKVKIIGDGEIDGEYIPLCPFCEQPIDGDLVIVKHRSYGQMCLAHSYCVSEAEEN